MCWFLLKVVSIIFLLLCFVNLKESTCETRKNMFCFISKALFVFEIIKFNFSDFQISWRHQMPMLETRNKFHWITWKVNTVWSWNLDSLCNIAKEKILSKTSMKNDTWKVISGSFLIFEESSVKRIWGGQYVDLNKFW